MEEIEECLRTITAPGDAKPGELGKSLQRLDEIAKDAGSGLHPRLRHFLKTEATERPCCGWRMENPKKAFAEDEPEQRTKGRKAAGDGS